MSLENVSVGTMASPKVCLLPIIASPYGINRYVGDGGGGRGEEMLLNQKNVGKCHI
jgi:hypothetical protein